MRKTYQKQGGHYLLRADTGEVRRIATLEQFQLASDWSPDGKRILGECAAPGSGICEVDAETGAVKPLLVRPTDQLLYPSWSRDGRTLTFMRRRPGSARRDLDRAGGGRWRCRTGCEMGRNRAGQD